MPAGAHETPRVEAAAIIGVGLIGGSLGMALKSRGLAGRVIGAARRRQTLDAALSRGAIDAGTQDPLEAAAQADLVVLAAPVSAIIAHIGRLAGRLRQGALVTDVGSTKVEIMRVAQDNLPPAVAFVGGHPIAGSERSGPGAARADLFEGAVWVLTPRAGDPESALDRMKQLVAALGAQPLVLEAGEHDALLALTSHLPHVAAWALVNAVAAGGGRQALASVLAPSFRDTTRIAQSDPAMWRDILLTNRGYLLPAIAALRGELDRLERALADGDADALATILDQAARARRELTQPPD